MFIFTKITQNCTLQYRENVLKQSAKYLTNITLYCSMVQNSKMLYIIMYHLLVTVVRNIPVSTFTILHNHTLKNS